MLRMLLLMLKSCDAVDHGQILSTNMQCIATQFICWGSHGLPGFSNSQQHGKTLDFLQMAQFVLAAQHRCNNGDYVVALDSTRDRLAAAARSRKAEKQLESVCLNCDFHKGRRTS